eukprot:TRINITY_DN9453_c0_g1_i1.p1 TRINITY_DN9453_c0_g1~~TRINITY_DN9453_c0_g1_i1.p1  ORF type:complete len:1304 (+),score=223.00 TRINITY_DN9453_c0_g1_i1:48-3914(+)
MDGMSESPVGPLTDVATILDQIATCDRLHISIGLKQISLVPWADAVNLTELIITAPHVFKLEIFAILRAPLLSKLRLECAIPDAHSLNCDDIVCTPSETVSPLSSVTAVGWAIDCNSWNEIVALTPMLASVSLDSCNMIVHGTVQLESATDLTLANVKLDKTLLLLGPNLQVANFIQSQIVDEVFFTQLCAGLPQLRDLSCHWNATTAVPSFSFPQLRVLTILGEPASTKQPGRPSPGGLKSPAPAGPDRKLLFPGGKPAFAFGSAVPSTGFFASLPLSPSPALSPAANDVTAAKPAEPALPAALETSMPVAVEQRAFSFVPPTPFTFGASPSPTTAPAATGVNPFSSPIAPLANLTSATSPSSAPATEISTSAKRRMRRKAKAAANASGEGMSAIPIPTTNSAPAVLPSTFSFAPALSMPLLTTAEFKGVATPALVSEVLRSPHLSCLKVETSDLTSLEVFASDSITTLSLAGSTLSQKLSLQIPNIEYLDLGRTNIPWQVLQQVCPMFQKLQRLQLSGCSHIQQLQFANPSLKSLILMDCTALHTCHLTCSRLERVEMSGCSAMEMFQLGEACEALEHVDLSHSSITNNQIEEMLTVAPKLRVLLLKHCVALSQLTVRATALETLDVEESGLQSLTITGACVCLTHVKLDHLVAVEKATIQTPEVKTISLVGCRALKSLQLDCKNLESIVITDGVSLCVAVIKCPVLQTLRIDGAPLDHEFISQFTRHAALQYLTLSRCSRLSRVPLSEVPELLDVAVLDCTLVNVVRITAPKLQHAYFGGCFAIADMNVEAEDLELLELDYPSSYMPRQLPTASRPSLAGVRAFRGFGEGRAPPHVHKGLIEKELEFSKHEQKPFTALQRPFDICHLRVSSIKLLALNLRQCPLLEDVSLKVPQLQRFVGSCSLTTETLQALTNCCSSALRELEFANASVVDVVKLELPQLQKFRATNCPRLTTVALTCPQLSVFHVSQTSRLRQLGISSLVLQSLDLTDLLIDESAVICFVSSIPALRTLDVSGTNVSLDGLQRLIDAVPDLETLIARRLDGSMLSFKSASVKTLDVSDNYALSHVQLSCPGLLRFVASRTRLTFMAVLAAARNCPSLTDLILHHCSQLKQDVDATAGLTGAALGQLNHLDLSASSANDAVVNLVQFVCPHLSQLLLSGCGELTEFASYLPKLTAVVLTGCRQLRRVIVHCASADTIRVEECAQLTTVDVKNHILHELVLRQCPVLEHIHLQCKQLQLLDVSGTSITDQLLNDLVLDSALERVTAIACKKLTLRSFHRGPQLVV